MLVVAAFVPEKGEIVFYGEVFQGDDLEDAVFEFITNGGFIEEGDATAFFEESNDSMKAIDLKFVIKIFYTDAMGG